MKALAIVFALLLLAMPVAAGPIELPMPGIVDQLYSWFTAAWEAMSLMVVPVGSDDEGHFADEDEGPPPPEMGPLIDPLG